MSGPMQLARSPAREGIEELRRRLGLFSFQDEASKASSSEVRTTALPELGVGPGGIVEWVVAGQGAGAVTSAARIVSGSLRPDAAWALVDPARECHVPALSGWGLRPSCCLVIQPARFQDTCWAIEQCLRCPGVAVTWAWVDKRVRAQVYRRWKLAAEIGGGLGLFFRNDSARREPVWADLRLRATPRAGGTAEVRRLDVEVLYRRGGLGGTAWVWEIDHAAGAVRLVSQVADSKNRVRAARA
jgi:hypothetical protein